MKKTVQEINIWYGAANFFYVTLFGVTLMVGLFCISPQFVSVNPITVRYFYREANVSDRPIRVHYYNRPPWVGLNIFDECDSNCYLTAEGHSYQDSEVVVFHTPYVKESHPSKRRGQIWVFHSLEPPWLNWCKFESWKREFNWTITFRRDSDFLYTYGRIQMQTVSELTWEREIQKLRELFDKKRGEIAWMVSHCGTPSKRDDYVTILKRLTPVDIYGGCGDKRCARSIGQQCYDWYKFYLSFENQLCEDYITEKSFKIFSSSVALIPVTRGGANYSMFLPPGSYIDSSEFQPISRLKDYIVSVSKNATKFLEYMKWRKHYQEKADHRKPFCELCRRLHSKDKDKYRRVYADIGEWQRRDKTTRTVCKEPKDLF
ncbi:alpha-(1,3)-fucosyltransferase C-like isoform X2 [Argopecten irradians]|uniref:alpha-(1,3)-fucosyltransferase C-like isoform X2 n=1 Tax=Argopecten irradians TaxID=31199 RepID=UPI0037115B3C